MKKELAKSVVATDEQRQVIQHPDGHHGRVLSVAGSGKTMTMAFRIEHLMKECRVTKRQIQVLMFNRLARNQFIEKLDPTWDKSQEATPGEYLSQLCLSCGESEASQAVVWRVPGPSLIWNSRDLSRLS